MPLMEVRCEPFHKRHFYVAFKRKYYKNILPFGKAWLGFLGGWGVRRTLSLLPLSQREGD